MASLGITVASNVDILDKKLTVRRTAKNVSLGTKEVWGFFCSRSFWQC